LQPQLNYHSRIKATGKKQIPIFSPGDTVKKILLLGLALSFFSCSDQREEWRITVLFPLTGFADYLAPVKEGLDLAAQQINASGGIGQRSVRLEYCDTASSPETAINIFEDALQDTSPDLILSVLSSVSTAISPLVAEAQIPTIAMVASDPRVPQLSDYIYAFYQGARAEIDALEPVLQKEGIRRLTVLHQNDEYGGAIYQEMSSRAAKLGLEVNQGPFQMDGSDIPETVAKHLDSEAFLIVGFEAVCLQSLEAIRQADYTGSILGTSTLSTRTFWENPNAQGLWVASPAVYNPAYLRAADFSALYSQTYRKPIHHNAAAGWDTLFLLKGLLENLQDKGSQSILSQLNMGFVFPGIHGDISKGQGEKAIPIPLMTARIMDSQLRF
jgi:branched-chain amino acid transport system substrate-binding protein